MGGLSRRSYRHSRASGNPEMPAGSMLVYGCTVLDSRLRGNDGRSGGNGYDGDSNDGFIGYGLLSPFPAIDPTPAYPLQCPYPISRPRRPAS